MDISMDICKDRSTLTSIRSTLMAPKSKALAFPETTLVAIKSTKYGRAYIIMPMYKNHKD